MVVDVIGQKHAGETDEEPENLARQVVVTVALLQPNREAGAEDHDCPEHHQAKDDRDEPVVGLVIAPRRRLRQETSEAGPLDDLINHSPFPSSSQPVKPARRNRRPTACRNCSPRSNSSRKRPKLAHPGESSTIEPGRAIALAASNAFSIE